VEGAPLTAFEREAGALCRTLGGRSVMVLTGALAEAQSQLVRAPRPPAKTPRPPARVLSCDTTPRWDDRDGDGTPDADELDSLTNDSVQCGAAGGSCLTQTPLLGARTCVAIANPFDLPTCDLSRADVLAGRQCLLTSSSNTNAFEVVIGYEPTLLPPALGDACDSLADDFACRAFGGLCAYTEVQAAVTGTCQPAADLVEPCEDEADPSCRIVFGDGGLELRRLASSTRRPTTLPCASTAELTEFERRAGVTCAGGVKVLTGALAAAESQIVQGPTGPLGCGIDPRWDDRNGNGQPDADELDSLTNDRQLCLAASGSCLSDSPFTGTDRCVAIANPFSLPECTLTADEVLAGVQCLVTNSSNLNAFEVLVGYDPAILPPAPGDRCDSLADEIACRAFDGLCGFVEVQPRLAGTCTSAERLAEPCPEGSDEADCRLVFVGEGFEARRLAPASAAGQ
jgi:hypothetical protein